MATFIPAKTFRARCVWLLAILAACTVTLLPQTVHAKPDVSREYQIKAAFLFHLAQFVEWPSTVPANGAPFCIGVLGPNPFEDALDKITRGESINGRPIAVRYSRRIQDLENCQIIFIHRDERPRTDEILKKLSGQPILTVGDFDDFARDGGIINFYLKDNKVSFEINPSVAKRERLKISAQLLRLGKVVE